MFGPSDVMRIHNSGDRTFKDSLNGTLYVVEPGQDKIVPFEAVCLWFGHPNARDEDARHLHRTEEVKRLRVKYGVYDEDEAWAVNVPSWMDVYSLETNEQLICVAHDPEGVNVNPSVMTEADNISLQQQLAAMQQQMAQMQALMEQQNLRTMAIDDGDSAAPDLPPAGEDSFQVAPSEDGPVQPSGPTPQQVAAAQNAGVPQGTPGTPQERAPRPPSTAGQPPTEDSPSQPKAPVSA